MPILTITGSARPDSSNVWLLQKLAEHLPQYAYRYFNIADLPLFQPTLDQHPWPPAVVAWRQAVATADAVIIATPEYIHNIPALLKNALEWVTSSGELAGKPVLPITFTPHAPRGERAMQSLLWSLEALDARIVVQLPLYQNEMIKMADGFSLPEEVAEMLAEAVGMLGVG
ncbi:MAG: NAD(P)H-dependent oxidoreductase [Bacteroidetes bacterium]|nr:MAG: NAD(P)H-dependent oxidoreductase [Bacteroidota bacterium]PTM11486.1 MAG: NAD(P)H-dependent oxidoreductase [Bacteroidota bacterium]